MDRGERTHPIRHIDGRDIGVVGKVDRLGIVDGDKRNKEGIMSAW